MAITDNENGFYMPVAPAYGGNGGFGGGAVTPIATAIVVSGEQRQGSRSIYTPAAVDEYGNVTSRAIIDVPRGCCFTVSVEPVNGTVNDPATTPTPLINIIDGSLSIERTA